MKQVYDLELKIIPHTETIEFWARQYRSAITKKEKELYLSTLTGSCMLLIETERLFKKFDGKTKEEIIEMGFPTVAETDYFKEVEDGE